MSPSNERSLKTWSWIGALALAASCGYPRLQPVGGGDDARPGGGDDARPGGGDDARPGGGDDAPPGDGSDGPGESPIFQLLALEPAIAHTGDVITLEGTFPADAVVHFPGGTTQTPILLGAHRATVTVPASASEGSLFLTSGASISSPLAFRRVSFATDLRGFEPGAAQPDGVHQVGTLPTPLSGHASVVIGSYLYVIGGFDGSNATGRVLRATINADGTLGMLADVPGVALVTARTGHTIALAGKYLYVMSGHSASNLFDDVERATVNADGSLGPFSQVAGARLQSYGSGLGTVVVGNNLYVLRGDSGVASVQSAVIKPDGSLEPFTSADGGATTTGFGATHVVIGNYVYTIGGLVGGGSSDGVERATINASGGLSRFAPVPGVKLTTRRLSHTATVIGDHLYVIGGLAAGTATTSVERATINSDGTLGSFAPVSGLALGTLRANLATVVAGNYLYALGGLNTSGELNTIERAPIIADGTLGTFGEPGATLASARSGHASAVTGSYLYLLGGQPKQGALNTVERAAVAPDGTLGAFAIAPGVTLRTQRSLFRSAVIGNFVYAIGGNDFTGTVNMPLNSVERAPIGPDGTLGTFEAVASTLATARFAYASVVIGNSLYLIGGNNSGPLASLERATINPDGSLDAFAIATGTSLSTARDNHAAVVIGGSVYVVGGFNGNYLGSVERATIAANGSVSTFQAVLGVSLVTPRFAHTCAVIGNYLYVVGGFAAGVPVASVERATINPDGTITTFSTVSGVALTAPRNGHTVAAIGNYLYVVGGHGTTDYAPRAERATLTGGGP